MNYLPSLLINIVRCFAACVLALSVACGPELQGQQALENRFNSASNEPLACQQVRQISSKVGTISGLEAAKGRLLTLRKDLHLANFSPPGTQSCHIIDDTQNKFFCAIEITDVSEFARLAELLEVIMGDVESCFRDDSEFFGLDKNREWNDFYIYNRRGYNLPLRFELRTRSVDFYFNNDLYEFFLVPDTSAYARRVRRLLYDLYGDQAILGVIMTQ